MRSFVRMIVQVVDPSGKIPAFIFTMNPNDCVADLRRRIRARIQIHAHCSLTCDGKTLQNSQTLASVAIRNHSTIEIHLP
jgi:hypothetical protein